MILTIINIRGLIAAMQRNNNNPSQQQPTTSAVGGDDDEPIQKINMDDYKAEVMRTFNLTTDEEYKKWVLAGNKLSPAPKRRSPTMYSERVKHAFGLTDEEWQRKVASGELLFRPSENYEDEHAQAKF
jgi:hypothetical protein